MPWGVKNYTYVTNHSEQNIYRQNKLELVDFFLNKPYKS